MIDVDFNALGQAIDTTWGRTSTPKTASYSVKFKLQGNLLIANYAAIVNFAAEKEMITLKQIYTEESQSIIAAVLKNVKSVYKEITGKALRTKEVSTSDSLEIIGFNVHNPKRSAYFRRTTTFEIA
jgi:hypothetical protein